MLHIYLLRYVCYYIYYVHYSWYHNCGRVYASYLLLTIPCCYVYFNRCGNYIIYSQVMSYQHIYQHIMTGVPYILLIDKWCHINLYTSTSLHTSYVYTCAHKTAKWCHINIYTSTSIHTSYTYTCVHKQCDWHSYYYDACRSDTFWLIRSLSGGRWCSSSD